MGKINSKRKGAEGEREAAMLLRFHGYDCRRGQQYNGADGSADVIGLPYVHLEIKRVEKLNLYDAMAQSKHDAEAAGQGEIPVVMHRKNHCRWLITLDFDDFIRIYREFEASMRLKEEEE